LLSKRATCCRLLLEAVYVLTHFFGPFIPSGGDAILKKLNVAPMAIPDLSDKFVNLKVGTPVVTGTVLYEVFDMSAAASAKEVQADSKVTKASPKAADKPTQAAAAAEVKKTEDKPKEKKQEKPAAAAKPAATGGAARDESDDAAAKISLIVGKVTKVWEHPDSDKLFCEEIDCGEAEVRQIGSGLRHFYKAEEFEGRMVLVVANLKPKKLAGFPSNGMVLCASSADHTDVKFVEVPAGAQIGERVVFGDLEMDPPAEPNPCEKKKLFIKAQPHFNAKGGVAMYKDKPFTLSSGVCTAPVADGYSLS